MARNRSAGFKINSLTENNTPHDKVIIIIGLLLHK